jgi:hypothetical protein
MAISIPIISEFVDKGIRSAEDAFKVFKAKVGEADGAMNKFKAGAGASLDFVKANAASLATAGGAALVAFGAKAVTAFQDLALSADKFSNATGLAVEDASRYMEVLGDIGVEEASLQTGLNKLNRAIADNSAEFAKAGIEIVKADNGATDVNKTFLNTVQALKNIKDPAEKARVATQLLGKGWQELSTVIDLGADRLTASLASVADAKVIDSEEVRRAKELRDTFDNLKDKGEEFALALGETVVPIISDVVEIITKVFNAVEAVTGAVSDFLNMLPGAETDWTQAMSHFEQIGAQLGLTIKDDLNVPLADTNEALQAQATEYVPKVTRAWDEFLGRLDASEALQNVKTDVQEVSELLAAAFSGEQIDTAELDGKVIDAQQSIGKFVGTLLDTKRLTEDQANRIKVLVETGDLERAVQLLDRLQNPTKGAQYTPGFGTIGFRAAGGPVAAGQSYIVGERGPELFTPSTAGSIAASGSFGAPSITVNMPSGASGDDVVRAIQRWVRDNGAVPMTTTTAIRR